MADHRRQYQPINSPRIASTTGSSTNVKPAAAPRFSSARADVPNVRPVGFGIARDFNETKGAGASQLWRCWRRVVVRKFVRLTVCVF